MIGIAAGASGLAILASQAFPVPGETVAVPAAGVALVVASAALLRVDPVAPLRASAEPEGTFRPGTADLNGRRGSRDGYREILISSSVLRQLPEWRVWWRPGPSRDTQVP